MIEQSLTTEVSVVVRAIQHNAAVGTNKQIWSEVCGSNYTTMKTPYPLKELEESHDKVTEIVVEATRPKNRVATCTRRLAAFKAPSSDRGAGPTRRPIRVSQPSRPLNSRSPSTRGCRRLALAEYHVRALEVRNRNRDLSGLAQDHGTPRKLVGGAL